MNVGRGSAAYTLVSSADLNARGNSDICTSLDDTTQVLQKTYTLMKLKDWWRTPLHL